MNIEKIPNRFRYTVEQYDHVTNQYYLRSRFYNPVIARFTQEDTYRGDGLSLYEYVHNNPVKYVDQSVAENFAGSSYTQTVLRADTIFYRVYGGDAKQVGSYMSRVPQNGGIQSQIDLALKPEWGNSTEYVTKVIVLKELRFMRALLNDKF